MPNPFALAEAFVSITGDDRPLSLKISDAKLKVDELAKKSATITIKGDNKEAQLALDDTRLKLLKLSQTTARPNINVQGIARADLELDKLSLKLDKLNAKSVSPLVKLGKSGALAPSLGGAALALSPSLIPLAGAVAGAVGAIGISFGIAGAAALGFGALARTVLTDAGTDATKLAALNLKLNAATTASAKDAIKAQIKALEAGWTPAYKQVMSGLASLKTGWKALAIQVAAPVIAPWLDVLNRALPLLKDGLQPVADLFQSWGQSLDKYFSNPVTVLHLKDIAATLGSFAAIQLGQIGKFLADIATAFFNLGKDIPAGTQLGAAGTDLAKIGDSFLTWSKSKAARDDVHGFFKFIHDDGGTVKTILKDLGTILPGIFKGASTVGTLELQAIAGFLTLIAKLPKGWQAPLTEAAGAMLLLAKTGVLKVGITLVGTAAKLISGGTLALGGTAAAAEMRAAFATGGAAAAAEIRAAMTGGGAAAGAGGAAGAAGESASIGAIAARARSLLIGIIADIGIPVLLANIFHLPGQSLSIWDSDTKALRDDLRLTADSFKTDWHDMASSFDAFRHDAATTGHAIAGSWDTLRHDAATTGNAIAVTWDTVRHDAATTGHDIASSFDTLRHAIATIFDGARHDIASAWATIWSNTRSVVSTGIANVVTFFKGLPGRALAALTGLGHSLGNFAAAALTEMLNGFKRIAGDILGWLGGFVGKIIGLVGKLLRLGSPSGVFFDIGKNMMLGLEQGIKAHAHKAANAAKGAALNTTAAGQAGGGVQRWRPTVLQALKMEHLPAGLVNDILYQMQTESGGNPRAINLTDSNAAAGDPSRGLMQTILTTFEAYHWPGTSWDIYNPLANIAAAINYAAHNRGFGPGPGQIGSGHGYDTGGYLMPGTTYAVNRTGYPELVLPRAASAPSRGGGGDARLIAALEAHTDELRHIKRLLGTGNAIAARAPAQTGYGMGRALSQATQRAQAHGMHSVSRPIA